MFISNDDIQFVQFGNFDKFLDDLVECKEIDETVVKQGGEDNLVQATRKLHKSYLHEHIKYT